MLIMVGFFEYISIALSICLIAGILIFILDAIYTPRVTEDQVLELLSDQWTTAIDITKKLNDRYCPGRVLFGTISLITTHVILKNLRTSGKIQWRLRYLTRDQLKLREGYEQWEFRKVTTE